MRLVGLDFETHEFEPGNRLPRIVCAGVCEHGQTRVLVRDEIPSAMEAWLCDPEVRLVNHFMAYDLGCLVSEHNWPELKPLVVQAYEAGRVHCTLVFGKLCQIAITGDIEQTRQSLAAAVERELGVTLVKDEVRTSYAALDGLPLSAYSQRQLEYVQEDAAYAVNLYETYLTYAEAHGVELGTVTLESQAAQGLLGITARGMCTDRAQVEKQIATLTNTYETELPYLLQQGLVEPKYGRVQYKPRKVVGYTVKRDRLTDFAHACGWVNTSKASLLESEHPLLIAVAARDWTNPYHTELLVSLGVIEPKLAPRRKEDEQPIEGYVVKKKPAQQWAEAWGRENQILLPLSEKTRAPKLDKELRAMLPDDAPVARQIDWAALRGQIQTLEKFRDPLIHPEFNSMVNTGRTSSGGGALKINFQNFRREAGFRECFEARPGYVLCAVDFDTIELRSLAQVQYEWFGRSALGEVIKAGKDAHVVVAALLAGVDYGYANDARKGVHGPAEATKFKALRNLAKAFNFGAPGGLAEKKFRAFALGTYKVEIAPTQWRCGTECPDGYYDIPEEHLPSGSAYLEGLPQHVQDKAWQAKANGQPLIKDAQDPRVPFWWLMDQYGGVFCRRDTFAYYRSQWLTLYPEMLEYFREVNRRLEVDEYLQCPACGFKRARPHYCAGCNHSFQHRTACGTKRGIWRLWVHAAERDIHPWAFVHDEIICEVPEDNYLEAGEWIAKQLCVGMQQVTSKVPITATPSYMYRWSKAASDPVFLENKAVPYEKWALAMDKADEDLVAYMKRREDGHTAQR